MRMVLTCFDNADDDAGVLMTFDDFDDVVDGYDVLLKLLMIMMMWLVIL